MNWNALLITIIMVLLGLFIGVLALELVHDHIMDICQ